MAERLVRLSTPGRLYKSHRDGFERVRLALHIAGIETGTTDSLHAMRTVAEQERIFLERYTPQLVGDGRYGDVRWWNYVRYVRTSPLGSAAIPGTSNHGRGDTADFQGLGGYDSATWKRAARILAEHGWDNTEGRSVGEPWHWRRFAANDNHATEEVMTVAQFDEIIKNQKAIAADIDWLKNRLGGSMADGDPTVDAALKALSKDVKAQAETTAYKDSGLARSVLEQTGDKASNSTKVEWKYVPVYAQAILYGIRALLKAAGEILDLLKKIAAKVGA